MFLLWEAGGQVVGFAARDPEENDLGVFVAPTLEHTPDAIALEDTALAWASERGTSVQWMEFDDEHDAVRRWAERGYLPTPGGYLNLTAGLERVDPHGPADRRVGSVADEDIADRAAITHAAFGSSRPLADYVADYERFRASPAYPHGWDLVLHDDDGRAAACCIAWIDPTSRVGTFEPVATHPRAEGRGYARALLTEGLRRFAAAGMTYAIVGVVIGNERAEAVYRSVGFAPDRVLRSFERS